MAARGWTLVLATGLIGACAQPVAGGKADGPAVFAAACATCHGSAGKPPASMAAALGVRDLTTAEFVTRATPALIENQVRRGSTDQKMPAFAGTLTADQVRAVAAYVMTLGRPAPAGAK